MADELNPTYGASWIQQQQHCHLLTGSQKSLPHAKFCILLSVTLHVRWNDRVFCVELPSMWVFVLFVLCIAEFHQLLVNTIECENTQHLTEILSSWWNGVIFLVLLFAGCLFCCFILTQEPLPFLSSLCFESGCAFPPSNFWNFSVFHELPQSESWPEEQSSGPWLL